jgi:hypothetical protein
MKPILDPDRWSPRDILKLVGWACVFLAMVLVFPTVGAGSGKSWEPGHDTVRSLVLDNGYGMAVVALAAIGAVVLVASRFARDIHYSAHHSD